MSHSDAEPVSRKKPSKKFGNASKPGVNSKQLKDGRGFLVPNVQGNLSDDTNNQKIVSAPDDITSEMKGGVSKIMVAVRLRPMWKKENDRGEYCIVKIMDRNLVILRDPQDVMNEEKVLGKNRSKEK